MQTIKFQPTITHQHRQQLHPTDQQIIHDKKESTFQLKKYKTKGKK